MHSLKCRLKYTYTQAQVKKNTFVHCKLVAINGQQRSCIQNAPLKTAARLAMLEDKFCLNMIVRPEISQRI